MHILNARALIAQHADAVGDFQEVCRERAANAPARPVFSDGVNAGADLPYLITLRRWTFRLLETKVRGTPDG